MTRTQFLSTPLLAATAASAASAAGASDYKPKRVNKAVELLAAGQPIYYAGGHGGYDEGKKLTQTHADYINYEMEHGALDFTALRRFMQGLVDGGPTKSGHRTPAVIATLPVLGISAAEYMKKADPWPLNPNGEFLLGLKVEDKHALANAEKVTAVPGIGFAEWGPGDMGISLDLPDGHGPNITLHPQMREARATVLNACKKNQIAFLNTVRENDVEAMIDEGVSIGAGASAATANKGRLYTKRQMPW
jgi:hypothetical protein